MVPKRIRFEERKLADQRALRDGRNQDAAPSGRVYIFAARLP